jgi:hypothetical protein
MGVGGAAKADQCADCGRMACRGSCKDCLNPACDEVLFVPVAHERRGNLLIYRWVCANCYMKRGKRGTEA